MNIVVTGATGGIGAHAAAALAREGHHVVLAARDTNAADVLRSTIVDAHPRASVSIAQLNLSTLLAARDGAARIRSVAPVVDVLVQNAGLFTRSAARTSDGYELHFGVMHLAHCQLLRDLRPAMTGVAPRVVAVSAWGHRFGRLDPSRLALDAPAGFHAYCRAKLAQVLYSLELGRRHPGLVTTAVHPGVVSTDLGAADTPAVGRWMLRTLAAQPDRAGAALASLALRDGLRTQSYYSFRTIRRRMSDDVARLGRRARDARLAADLFDATEGALLP